MKGLAKNIDALIRIYDINPYTLAQVAGVSESSVSRWRNGGNIRDENLNRILDHFELKRDDILSETSGLAAKETGTYNSSFPGARPVTCGEPAYVKVVEHLHAGNPMEVDETDYLLEVPTHIKVNHPNAFGCVVDGDCMDKVYPEGCLVVIDPAMKPRSGVIGAYLIDGYEKVMRRVFQGANTLILSPESYNPEHKDLVFSDSDEHTVEGIGTVVWFQAKEELS